MAADCPDMPPGPLMPPGPPMPLGSLMPPGPMDCWPPCQAWDMGLGLRDMVPLLAPTMPGFIIELMPAGLMPGIMPPCPIEFMPGFIPPIIAIMLGFMLEGICPGCLILSPRGFCCRIIGPDGGICCIPGFLTGKDPGPLPGIIPPGPPGILMLGFMPGCIPCWDIMNGMFWF